MRADTLETFLSVALDAAEHHATDDRSRASLARIRERLSDIPPGVHTADAEMPPVVSQWLGPALRNAPQTPRLAPLLRAIRHIAPELRWSPKPSATEEVRERHANAMLVGPGGWENRPDVWIGLSLLAPGLRYPDHDHAPEETYLVLSDGEFRVGTPDWFTPGPGGSFYVPPGYEHAMRSGEEPLLALWMLKA